MSLKPLESVQLNTFFSTGAFSSGTFHALTTLPSDSPRDVFQYVDRVGAFIATGIRVQSGTDPLGMLQFDPAFADNTVPLSKFFETSTQNPTFLALGEWDRVNNIQNIYGGSDPPKTFQPVDPTTYIFDTAASNLWPALLWDIKAIGGSASIGGWDDVTCPGGWVFFETWGYALHVCRVRHTDNVLYRGLAQIDLVTGLATLLAVPTRFVNVPAALFEAPSFQGDQFTMGRMQFVPDDDSVVAAPKGRLFLWSMDLLSTLGDVDNSDSRTYLKIVEFNPFSTPPTFGNPNRVHLRELTFTRLLFFQRQAFGTNPNSLGTRTINTPFIDNWPTRFDPLSRTLVTLSDYRFQDDSEERGYVRHSTTPFLSAVEPPTPISEVETAKTVTFRSKGFGDLGDPLAGIDATWSLARRSTVDEILDTSAAPVSNFVAHPPIDVGTLVVKLNGTPLTITTDYTVNEATGEITWAGTHSPPALSGYTASYLHSTVNAQPPHGILLQTLSVTDETGVAETRVQYPDDDDLVGDRDRLVVSMSDD